MEFKLFIYVVLVVLVSSRRLAKGVQVAKIGIIVEKLDSRQQSNKFWSFAQNGTSLVLEPVVRVAPSWGTLEVARAVCDIVEEGPHALVVLGPPRLHPLLSSYSDHLSLPLVTGAGDPLGRYQVGLLPDTSRAAAAVMAYYKWDSFTFLYHTDNGADSLERVLRSLDFAPRIEGFWRLSDASHASQFVSMLSGSPLRILLAVSEELADDVIRELVATRKTFHFILLTPVGVVGSSPFPGAYRLTKFSVVDPTEPLLKVLENRWRTLDIHPGLRAQEGKDLPDSVILIHDASSALYSTYSQLLRAGRPLPVPNQKRCFSPVAEDPQAALIREAVVPRSVTGRIRFDSSGRRKDFLLNVVETSASGTKKVGTWTEDGNLTLTTEFVRAPLPPPAAIVSRTASIRVTSVQVWPFLRRNPDGTYTGFVQDLVDELSVLMRRTFSIQLVKDGRYGFISNGSWTGMIGEVIRKEADVALAPLTKTVERAEVIDFSRNFMTVGLNILVKKKEGDGVVGRHRLGPFAFLSVWSEGVWLLVLLGAALSAALAYALGRFTGAPDRVRALETKSTDEMSPCGSLFLTCGSLLFRSTGIYPRTVSHRLWALLWWAFCLFLLLMYTASLSSDLIQARSTVTTLHSRTSSQQLLMDLMENGYPDIGVVKGGSTMGFFMKSEIGLYRDFGRYLGERPGVMMGNYDEAVQRVRNSGGAYAFVAESSTGELWADTPPCDILVTSGFLNTINYAAALPKQSSIKNALDDAIVTLMERGVLRGLYEKWWHNSSSCADPNFDILSGVYSHGLTLHEVSGVFYLLLLFALLSVATAAAEHYVRARRVTIE